MGTQRILDGTPEMVTSFATSEFDPFSEKEDSKIWPAFRFERKLEKSKIPREIAKMGSSLNMDEFDTSETGSSAKD